MTAPSKLICSFCDRKGENAEVKKMITTIRGSTICDLCVKDCVEVLQTQGLLLPKELPIEVNEQADGSYKAHFVAIPELSASGRSSDAALGALVRNNPAVFHTTASVNRYTPSAETAEKSSDSTTIFNHVKAVIVQHFGDEIGNKVTESSNFTGDLGMDSLDLVELVMAFEEEFGVEISDDEAEKILTVADTVSYLEQHVIWTSYRPGNRF